jgi:hypothetical protein
MLKKLPSGQYVNPQYVARIYARDQFRKNPDSAFLTKPAVLIELATGSIINATECDRYDQANALVDEIADLLN